jgi:glutathione-regulated potassium-efflux system ancillary protein KefG
MMKTLVLLAHPHLENSRLNKRLLTELEKHPEITVHPLYSQYPDWKIDVPKEQALVLAHDRIVFQFPLYWYSVPPLLKKWQDDVLTYGWAYGSQGKALHGKELMIATSIGGDLSVYQAGGKNHYSISEILRPLQATANICGMNYAPAFVTEGRSDDQTIEKRAHEYLQRLRSH